MPWEVLSEKTLSEGDTLQTTTSQMSFSICTWNPASGLKWTESEANGLGLRALGFCVLIRNPRLKAA